jgi:hypothetical protein
MKQFQIAPIPMYIHYAMGCSKCHIWNAFDIMYLSDSCESAITNNHNMVIACKPYMYTQPFITLSNSTFMFPHFLFIRHLDLHHL